MVLGRIVESVSGTSLDELLQSRLYGPLGLTSTGFHLASVSPGPAM